MSKKNPIPVDPLHQEPAPGLVPPKEHNPPTNKKIDIDDAQIEEPKDDVFRKTNKKR
jgi:hypothetical protein